MAIVDLGFEGYARSQVHGDLPLGAVRVNFCGSGGFEATSHGTAVAEIVAEVAPAADLYLVCVRDAAGLGRAVGYAREKGIHIVNHSASWFNTGRGDGAGAAGTPEGIVTPARAAGILWVNTECRLSLTASPGTDRPGKGMDVPKCTNRAPFSCRIAWA